MNTIKKLIKNKALLWLYLAIILLLLGFVLYSSANMLMPDFTALFKQIFKELDFLQQFRGGRPADPSDFAKFYNL